MSFLKKIWTDRVSAHPNRRILTNEDSTTNVVTVARYEGTVSQQGDAFSATNMNDLEDRVEAGFNELSVDLDELNSNLTERTKVLETKSVAVTFTSTKSQGHPNKVSIPLSKDYRFTCKDIGLRQVSNAEWVTCSVYGIDANNAYVQYNNYFTSAISGNITINIIGV